MRLRTTNANRENVVFATLSLGDTPADSGVADQLLAAELGFGPKMPSVLTQLFLDPADLWLPMSADGDTSFPLLAPAPKDATSVLGLLLRNSALRVAADATNEFSGLHAGVSAEQVGRTAYIPAAVDLVAASVAPPPPAPAPAPPASSRVVERVKNIAATSAFSATPSIATLVAGQGKDASGQTFMIDDRLAHIVAGKVPADLGRYFNSDALAAFSAAIGAIGGIPTDRRAVLTGDILDCASHRYDAWVTSLATARLAGMQSGREIAGGNQLGAWGAVRGIQRRHAHRRAGVGCHSGRNA